MSTLSILVQTNQKKRDGKSAIVILLIHKREKAYIKTEWYASEKHLDKNEKLKDKFLIRLLNQKIELYEDTIVKRLGNKIDLYSAKELKDFLIKSTNPGTDESIDFVAFALLHINRIKSKQKSRARRIQTTLNSFIDFFGRDKISISELTSKLLKQYEEYLLSPHTITRLNQFGKEVTYDKPALTGVRDYMTDLRTIFNAAKLEYNDDDKGELRIIHNPFTKYEMPDQPEPVKRNLDIETIRLIINSIDLKVSGTHGVNRAILARDCFELSFRLVGMNTIDLYHITTFKDGRLEYNRAKTKERRKDNAFISIKAEPETLRLIEKYRDQTGKRVFCFYQMYSTYETFNAAINKGLKQVASALEIKVPLSTYWARISWATIARNHKDCRISKDDIHLALNHVDEGMKVTDKYLAKDWTLIDEANQKVQKALKVPPIKNSLKQKKSPANHKQGIQIKPN